MVLWVGFLRVLPGLGSGLIGVVVVGGGEGSNRAECQEKDGSGESHVGNTFCSMHQLDWVKWPEGILDTGGW